jgi:8-oxo-dGTP pyrophosphatase MutT (NUDIX family)
MLLTEQSITAAMQLSGFEHWRPHLDERSLNRPQRRPAELPGDGRSAAVLLLIYPVQPKELDRRHPEESELRLVLTRRHETLTQHAGQISLPGGQRDKGESLKATALRETEEEIGVSSDAIKIVGRLNSIYIPPTDFTVAPFVGWSATQPRFVPELAEVAEIIEVSLDHLLNPNSLGQGEVKIASGETISVPIYQVDHHRVWGATAMILAEFVERLKRVRLSA